MKQWINYLEDRVRHYQEAAGVSFDYDAQMMGDPMFGPMNLTLVAHYQEGMRDQPRTTRCGQSIRFPNEAPLDDRKEAIDSMAAKFVDLVKMMML